MCGDSKRIRIETEFKSEMSLYLDEEPHPPGKQPGRVF